MSTNKPSHRPKEAGTVLVVALLFAMTIMAYTLSLVTSTVAVQHQNRYLIAGDRALDAAEAGVHHLLAAANGGQDINTFIDGGLEAILMGNADSARATRYEVQVFQAGGDGADNDLDGLVDEPDESDMIEVLSVGFADNVSRSVRVTMLARYRTPTIPSAVYLADPTTPLSLKGNAFTISGFEFDEDGQLVANGDMSPGIGVPGDPTFVANGIPKKAHDNVKGEGGSPSVLEVELIDFEPLIEDAIRSADVTLNGADKGPSEEGAWGTTSSPKIVFGSGDLHFSGNGQGVGILVVDGNLKISGGFQWVGLVIVRGKLDLTGGGSGKRLIGGMIVEQKFTAKTDNSGNTIAIDPAVATGTIETMMGEFNLIIEGAEDAEASKNLQIAVDSMGDALHALSLENLKGAGHDLEQAYAALVEAIDAEEISSERGKELARDLKALSKELKAGVLLEAGGSLNATGTIDILYSPKSVARVARFFSSLSILNWREGPTPNRGAAP